jgi:transcriptional regulator of acetoin/glycerol metabolism
LPKASQAALLRVLQEREVVPVGATRPLAVDVRVLAATHQPLDRLIERGDFRQDLYARVAGCVLELPLLRERRDDLGILIAALLSKNGSEAARAATFAPDAGLALLTYDWPMNVRELEQCVSTCVALATSGRIDASHLPPNVAGALRSDLPTSKRRSSATLSDRDEGLRLDLLSHLSRFQGNVTDVARAMGKPRTQIHRWCKRFSVNPDAFRN